MRTQADEMTPREYQEFENEKVMAEMQIDYNLKAKQLEIDATKLESRVTALYRLPMALIMLPVKLLFALAYIAAVIVKYEVPEQFWKFIGVK